jgi:predicted transcriptional regulator
MVTHTIEIDETTAAALEQRAKTRGQSVAEVVADLVASDLHVTEQTSAQIAELDRRRQRFGAQSKVASNDQVVRWLESWGTSDFRPWSSR